MVDEAEADVEGIFGEDVAAGAEAAVMGVEGAAALHDLERLPSLGVVEEVLGAAADEDEDGGVVGLEANFMKEVLQGGGAVVGAPAEEGEGVAVDEDEGWFRPGDVKDRFGQGPLPEVMTFAPIFVAFFDPRIVVERGDGLLEELGRRVDPEPVGVLCCDAGLGSLAQRQVVIVVVRDSDVVPVVRDAATEQERRIGTEAHDPRKQVVQVQISHEHRRQLVDVPRNVHTTPRILRDDIHHVQVCLVGRILVAPEAPAPTLRRRKITVRLAIQHEGHLIIFFFFVLPFFFLRLFSLWIFFVFRVARVRRGRLPQVRLMSDGPLTASPFSGVHRAPVRRRLAVARLAYFFAYCGVDEAVAEELRSCPIFSGRKIFDGMFVGKLQRQLQNKCSGKYFPENSSTRPGGVDSL